MIGSIDVHTRSLGCEYGTSTSVSKNCWKFANHHGMHLDGATACGRNKLLFTKQTKSGRGTCEGKGERAGVIDATQDGARLNLLPEIGGGKVGRNNRL